MALPSKRRQTARNTTGWLDSPLVSTLRSSFSSYLPINQPCRGGQISANEGKLVGSSSAAEIPMLFPSGETDGQVPGGSDVGHLVQSPPFPLPGSPGAGSGGTAVASATRGGRPRLQRRRRRRRDLKGFIRQNWQRPDRW